MRLSRRHALIAMRTDCGVLGCHRHHSSLLFATGDGAGPPAATRPEAHGRLVGYPTRSAERVRPARPGETTRPKQRPLVCFDERLRTAAAALGFSVRP